MLEKQKEIERQKIRHADLVALNKQICDKNIKLSVLDTFLKEVIKDNSDEFEGAENVVSRYKTLKESNERLKKRQRSSEKKIERLSEQIALAH